LGGMRQHETHRTGSSPCTAPGISGSLSTLPLSENDSEHVSCFYDSHWKKDAMVDNIDYVFSAHLAVTVFCCCCVTFLLTYGLVCCCSVLLSLSGWRWLFFFGVGVARA